MTTHLSLPRIANANHRIAILFIILTVPVWKSCAQSLKSRFVTSAIMEKTIVEKQAGGSFYLQLPSQLRIGGFYQSTFDNKIEGTTDGTFWGALVAAPIVKSGKLNFYSSLRAGFVDNIFFVATPGVITELKISNNLSLDIGLSIRKGYLSGTTNLNFRL